MSAWLPALLRRLHFYAGVALGPFLLLAALSGALYAVAPSLEQGMYRQELSAPAYGTGQDQRPLAEQVETAERVLPDLEVYAVRPAPGPGDTTRVLFTDPALGASEWRTVFVDPASLEPRGELVTYGSSGSLPLRTAISQIHRHLGLGEPGRLYSEFAASWLWVVALAGVGLWLIKRRRKRQREANSTGRARTYQRWARWHGNVGAVVALAALFLSATGLTWSTYAGSNVSDLRSTLSWTTPAVDTGLPAATSAGDLSTYDSVLSAARHAGLDAAPLEIVPSADAAWKVSEIQRSFPTQVDAVAVDPATLDVTDRVDFEDYGFVAKLARWGIDLHMGTLFGVPNQIVLAATALSLAAMVIMGYVLWFQRGRGRRWGRAPGGGVLLRAPWWALLTLFAGASVVGVFLPMLGIPLAAFIALDGVLAAAGSRQRPAS